jgi:hypothetical protein
MYDPTLNPKSELAYDLRQTIAEIIGQLLMEITAARLERRYVDWMNLLDNFHTEISMKLSATEESEYVKTWNETMNHVQNFKEVFEGRSQDSNNHSEVYGKIKLLEMWLRKKADKHDIFGSKRRSEGLS